MLQLQSAFIWLFSPFSKVNNEQNRKFRYGIIIACLFIMFLNILIGYTNIAAIDGTTFWGNLIININNMGDLGRAILGMVILFIVGALSVESKLQLVKWKWYIVYTWIALALIVIISGIFHDIGSGLLATQFGLLFIFTGLYFIWNNNRDMAKLFIMVSTAFSILVIAYSLFCMIKYPFIYSITNARYMATTHNPNLLGFFAAVGCITSLFLLGKKNNKYWTLNSITMGFSVGFLALTLSRSSLLAVIIALVIWLITYLINKKSIKLLIAMALISLIAFSSFYLITCRGNDSLELFSCYSNSNTVYATDGVSETSTSSRNNIFSRIDDFSNFNQYSSGRIGIWSLYINELNYSGNDVSLTLPMRVVRYDGSGTLYYQYAHNTVLELAFRSGISAGILMIMVLVFSLVFVIRKLINCRNMNYSDLFTIMAIIVFIVIGSVESIEFVFSRDVTLVFYLSLAPLFTGDNIKLNVRNTDA